MPFAANKDGIAWSDTNSFMRCDLFTRPLERCLVSLISLDAVSPTSTSSTMPNSDRQRCEVRRKPTRGLLCATQRSHMSQTSWLDRFLAETELIMDASRKM
jgi:hypothetical protein